MYCVFNVGVKSVIKTDFKQLFGRPNHYYVLRATFAREIDDR